MQKALRARKCFFTLISMLFTRPALRTRSMKPSAPIASLTCPSTERRTIPYDFLRKRLSILVAHGDTHLMVTKGALANVLAVCSAAETEGERIVDIAVVRDKSSSTSRSSVVRVFAPSASHTRIWDLSHS